MIIIMEKEYYFMIMAKNNMKEISLMDFFLEMEFIMIYQEKKPPFLMGYLYYKNSQINF